jgi:osmotically-inducible protein OsmY
VRPDNSAVNERDRDDKTLLPTDQGSSTADTEMTAEIRREVLKIEDLSFNGRQVKIITNNGKVALRGPVASDAERKAIEEVAYRVAKKENVTSALEVAP